MALLLCHHRKEGQNAWGHAEQAVCVQVDSNLDRFMVDLRKRIKQRGETSSSASDMDQAADTIHLTLKTGALDTHDTASSKAAAPASDVAVQSVAVSMPVDVPQPSVSRKEALAMELCKPPGASGTALPAPCLIRLQNCTATSLLTSIEHKQC